MSNSKDKKVGSHKIAKRKGSLISPRHLSFWILNSQFYPLFLNALFRNLRQIFPHPSREKYCLYALGRSCGEIVSGSIDVFSCVPKNQVAALQLRVYLFVQLLPESKRQSFSLAWLRVREKGAAQRPGLKASSPTIFCFTRRLTRCVLRSAFSQSYVLSPLPFSNS